MILKSELLAHTCNPIYLEGGHQEDCGLWPAWAKMLERILTNKLSMMVSICNASYMAGIGRRIAVPGKTGEENLPKK
jgi:hypothetical protein